jgi:hypothetical protein
LASKRLPSTHTTINALRSLTVCKRDQERSLGRNSAGFETADELASERSNQAVTQRDSASGEVQLQPIVPGIPLGAKSTFYKNKIFFSDA